MKNNPKALPARYLGLRAFILISAIAFLLAAPGIDAQPPLSVNVTFTWDLGVRVGIDYRPWDHVGFVADVGSTLFSFEEDGGFILTYNAFVVVHAFPPEESWQLSACIGVPDGRTVFVDPLGSELAFGGSVQGSYRITNGIDLYLRVGGGAPFFWEEGSWQYDRPGFPLGLWPDLSVGMKAALGSGS